MKKNQGSVEVVIVTMFVALLCIDMFLVTMGVQQANLYDRWTKACVNAGGIVGMVGMKSYSTSYECFIDGKITTLPGYEQYSTGIKN